MFAHKSVLVVRFIHMPEDVQDELRDWHLFKKDCLLELSTSYRLGDDEQIPENMLKDEHFRELYGYLKGYDKFEGSFDEFLTSYHLRTLYWLTTQNLDLKGVDQVLVQTDW